MEKAKQAAEDNNRRLSSSSSSFTSDVSVEEFPRSGTASDSNIAIAVNNIGAEKVGLHPDDLLELGAEGKKMMK